MSTRRRRALAVLLAVGLGAAALSGAAAAGADEPCTATWTGGAGAWEDAARWSPAVVPGVDDDVCIGRAPGAPAVSVRVNSFPTVAGLTLTGATLAVATGTALFATQFDANRATLTGGGTVAGTFGITRLTDTRLAGVHVSTPSRFGMAGRITVTGGSTVAVNGTGGIDLAPGLQVVDADGNPGNHLQFAKFPLYLSGTVFLGVRTALVDTVLFSQGDVTLAALDNLDADGVLRPGPGRTLQLGTGGEGRLHLPRTVTAIARGVNVSGGRIDVGDYPDALSGLTSVDGSLYLDRPLRVPGPLVVRGRLGSSSSVSAGGGVNVRHGGSFTAARVDGALTSAGSLGLAGARVGRLTLLAGSDTTTDLDTPLVVGGRATLAGTLTVQLRSGRQPARGTSLVLLTAAQGVTGRFDAVVTDRPTLMALTPDYQPTWLTATVAAPTG